MPVYISVTPPDGDNGIPVFNFESGLDLNAAGEKLMSDSRCPQL